MERTEVNCLTGEIKVIQLTAEEIAALPIPVPPTYSELRAAAYPPIVDQLDSIFHRGLDAWKAEIQAVKTQFPKGAK
jgi:hypothetical protein